MKGIPAYLEIKKKLLKEIEEKPVNTPICSERELSFMHKSSRMTVRRAIGELVDEGILYRDKNRGTFVADRKLNRKNTATEDLQNRETSDYRIIYYSVKDADRQIAPFLGIGTQNLCCGSFGSMKPMESQRRGRTLFQLALFPESGKNRSDESA